MIESSENPNYRIDDVYRRIRNNLDYCPAGDWNLDEASVVLAALDFIVRGRQTQSDVVDNLGA